MPKEKLSRSKDLAARVVYAALQVLREKGGQAPRKELIEEVPSRVQLDDWARTVYEKTGYLRWQSKLSFFSIAYLKAAGVGNAAAASEQQHQGAVRQLSRPESGTHQRNYQRAGRTQQHEHAGTRLRVAPGRVEGHAPEPSLALRIPASAGCVTTTA